MEALAVLRAAGARKPLESRVGVPAGSLRAGTQPGSVDDGWCDSM